MGDVTKNKLMATYPVNVIQISNRDIINLDHLKRSKLLYPDSFLGTLYMAFFLNIDNSYNSSFNTLYGSLLFVRRCLDIIWLPDYIFYSLFVNIPLYPANQIM